MTDQRNIFPPSDALAARMFSFAFARAYLVTMRPYLLFVSGITGIAGLSLSPLTSLPQVILFSLVFYVSYGFGQALTDCSQVDTDSLSSPYRPLVRGEIRRRDVMIVSLLGLAISGLILVVASRLNAVLALLAIGGLATYTWFKRRWWAGPFYNAWIVAVLCLIGYVTGDRGYDMSDKIPPALIATLIVAFFGYANFVLTGYYKDISADRATGYYTLPVVFGLRTSAVISDVFAAVTVFAAGLALHTLASDFSSLISALPALAAAAAGVCASLLAQIRLHKIKDEAEAHRAITPVVHSYILLLSSIVVAARPGWTMPIALFYLGFVFVIRSRPAKQQV